MRTSLLPLSLLLFSATTVLASPPAEAPPSTPLVAKAPANSQWTVTYKPKVVEKKSANAAKIRDRKMRQRYSPLVVSTNTIKAPGKMVVYTTYEAGMKSEAWVVGGYIYELPYREDANMRIDRRSQEDFPELSWISAANFRGTIEVKKHKFHFYEADVPTTRPAPAEPPQSEPTEAEGNPPKMSVRRAYIDPETRLPSKVETDDTVMTYEFAEPPATFPEMDERVAQQLKPSKR